MATPRLTADAKSLREGKTTSVYNVLSNDVDATAVTQIKFGSGAAIPVTSGGTSITGVYGTLTIKSDGTWTYAATTAAANALPQDVPVQDVFTYTAVSSTGETASTTLTFNVAGGNDAPVLTGTKPQLNGIQAAEVDNAGQTVASFLSSTDVDTGALKGIAINGLTSGNGTWQYSTNGGSSWSNMGAVSSSSALLLRSTDLVRFVPNGVDATSGSFTFRAWDQTSGTAGATVSIGSTGGGTAFSTALGTASIAVTAGGGTPTNAPPVAGNDSASTNKDSSVLINVLGNDQDPDGDTLVLTGFTAASNGTVSIQSGKILYTPNTGYVGADSFTYTVSDGHGGTDVATVAVTINAPANDPPVATDDSASTTKDTAILIDVLANDDDPDGGTLSIVSVSGAAHGTVAIQSGKVLYTPNSGYLGTDSFIYTVSDGQGGSDVGSVGVSVNAPSNTPPVATNDSATTTEDNAILIDVLANDQDADGGTLSIASVTGASNGTVTIQNGKVLYTPEAGYTGSDTFTYTVSDGQGGTDVGSVGVTVRAAAPAGTIAKSVSFQQGTNGYTGAVDTMLKQDMSSVNFGSAFILAPESDSGNKVQGLLAFNNLFGSGPGQIPVGATILSATLTLRTTDPSPSGGTIYPMLANWTGSSTWSSLGSGVQIGTEATTSGAVAVGSVAAGARSFDVTASVQSWFAAGSTSTAQNAANHGWLFEPGSTDSWSFGTSETMLKPTLVVTYVPAGAPSNPSLPSVSISAPTGTHMEDGGKISFTVTLSQASAQDITVNYATANGTALSGSDFQSANGSITFLAGQTSKVIDVTLTNDSSAERPETFALQLTSATNAKIGTAVATGRITDDDVSVSPMPPISASIVAIHNLANGQKYLDGSGGTYGISDPSAIAYIPSLAQLFIGDSEHNESPFNSSINLFAVRPDGSYVRNYSLVSYTKEPTGLAYNPNDGFLYVADDDAHGVFRVSPSNPSAKLSFFDTRPLGFWDTEDLKVDPVTGHIHILDGTLLQLVELTTSGAFVDSIPLPSIMKDAEALAYDAMHDVFFVGSGASPLIWAMDRGGNILASISVLSSYNAKPKGFELAPSSDPNDGDTLSLYVVDYGKDQVNDGRLFEISLGSHWLF